jgi:hypothetical protein
MFMAQLEASLNLSMGESGSCIIVKSSHTSLTALFFLLINALCDSQQELIQPAVNATAKIRDITLIFNACYSLNLMIPISIKATYYHLALLTVFKLKKVKRYFHNSPSRFVFSISIRT